jgi:hypothetical protein
MICDCWTKSKISVMAIGSGLRRIADLFDGTRPAVAGTGNNNRGLYATSGV